MIFFLTVRNSCKMLPFDPQEQENNQIAFLIGLLLFFFAALAAIYLVEGSLFNLYSLLLFVFSFSTGFSIFAYFDALKDRAERVQERSQEDAPELELPPLKEQLYEEKDLV